FAGYSYWFPKFTGFRLHEGLGKAAFWCWLWGFLVAFMPLYVLGFMGATRRMNHYPAGNGWQPLFVLAALGVILIFTGFILQIVQFIYSVRHRDSLRENADDPWDGRNLEWSTTSPPPFYNFAFTPVVHGRDAFWAMKHEGAPKPEQREYEDIHMPKHTGAGFAIGTWSCVFGFAMVWLIWWLVAVSFIAMMVHLFIRLCEKETEYYVPAAEVKEIEMRRQST
ncbi:MAG: cbb3-type cytochrome c oxidase subunit I, partial [Simkaniaceae bacterium]|nr:cbb3-type cytochrome c oxidase subunit I [Simkaniaceae bacterium]